MWFAGAIVLVRFSYGVTALEDVFQHKFHTTFDFIDRCILVAISMVNRIDAYVKNLEIDDQGDYRHGCISTHAPEKRHGVNSIAGAN